MKYGIYTPNWGPIFETPRKFVELAQKAEDAGWDGLFLWDHVNEYEDGVTVSFTDVWTMLGAIATNTEKIQIGTTVTALPRRRPWKLAREIVAVNKLSEGRFTFGVGLGVDGDYQPFHDEMVIKNRAEMVQESLDIITGLISGEVFSYQGKHFTIEETQFLPKPIGKIPIWCAGTWPNKGPFKRAAHYDGIIPLIEGFEDPVTTEVMNDIKGYLLEHRKNLNDFDLVKIGGRYSDDRYYEEAKAFESIGTTWWLETVGPWRDDLTLEEMIDRGPN